MIAAAPAVKRSAGWPAAALADDAPRYAIAGVGDRAGAGHRARDARGRAGPGSVLLELLGSPNARDRKPIWRRYDHMNGTNTLVGPGAGDAALLRVKGTDRALALAIDGPWPARIGALDPYLAGASGGARGRRSTSPAAGATPIGITDCLNFGSPETDLGAWQLSARSTASPTRAGRSTSRSSLATSACTTRRRTGRSCPTPVVGTVGLLEDREPRSSMAWHAGDEMWLLGEPAR